MAVLTQEMKDMIAGFQCFIGTVGKDGIPNVAPKRSTMVLDDNTLMFTESTGGATYRNILDGSKVAVAVVNRDVLDGYRFVGTAELQSSGPYFDKAAAASAKANFPVPKGIVLIHIEEIYSLKPSAPGRKIG